MIIFMQFLAIIFFGFTYHFLFFWYFFWMTKVVVHQKRWGVPTVAMHETHPRKYRKMRAQAVFSVNKGASSGQKYRRTSGDWPYVESEWNKTMPETSDGYNIFRK